MTILVTGGTGFVGKALVRGLLDKGHRVRCLVRNLKKAGQSLPRSVERVEGDVMRAEGLDHAITGCQAVIHLVGIITEKRGATFEEVHVSGTQNVLQAARQAGVNRYLHMSALGSRPNAKSRYHQTKYRAEESVRQSGLGYVIFRPSVIFGPGDRFVNLLAGVVRFSPVVLIVGDGQAKIQPVALGDVVQCFISALERNQIAGREYDLGGPTALSFEEVVDTILRVLGRRRIKVHLPAGLVYGMVSFFEKVLPVMPLTRDQLIMLQEDNVCEIEPARTAFGIHFQDFSEGIRSYIGE